MAKNTFPSSRSSPDLKSEPSKGKHEPMRLVLVGTGGVGKSALAIRFLQDEFIDAYEPTIESSHQKEVVDEVGEVHQLEIMDTAGQEEYSALRDRFVKTGEGFLVVYSVTSVYSFEQAMQLRNQILRIKENPHVPMVLVANKSDLECERAVSREEGKIISEKWGVAFIEASAKLNDNVEETFNLLVEAIAKNRHRSRVGSESTQLGKFPSLSSLRRRTGGKQAQCCMM